MSAAWSSGFLLATISLLVVAGWAVGWCRRWHPQNSSHAVVRRAGESGGSRTCSDVLPAAPSHEGDAA